MEKASPHYRLAEIKAQMVSVEDMHPTFSARAGIRALGMSMCQALAVVQRLNGFDFHKSMTANNDHRIWQDVYHCLNNDGVPLYVKFCRTEHYYVLSFKERDDDR